MIYFIRAGSDGPIKIGKAADVQFRRTELQVAHYEPLTVIRTIEGGFARENWLHTRFRERHIRGEWFQFCQTMLTIEPPEFIERKCARDPFIEKAIAACGGVRALGRRIGLSSQAISMWRRIPWERALDVEAATGGAVRVQDVHPDIWPATDDLPSKALRPHIWAALRRAA